MIEDFARRPQGRPPVGRALNSTENGKNALRKDAAFNRAKLIAAARDIMRETGGDVPFETIAVQAGVTRGTLYRNFGDRQALYEAVLEHELEIMVTDIAALRDDDTLGFLRILTEMMTVYDKFLKVFPTQPDYKANGVSRAKISAVIALPLARAKRRNVLRSELTANDVQLVCRMLAAHWQLDYKASFREAFDDRLKLFMRGLGEAGLPDLQI